MSVTPLYSNAPAASGGGTTSVAPQQAAERREVIKAVNVINANQTFGANNELVFSIDKDTRLPIARVIDSDTNEVILQIPAQVVLNLAAAAEDEQRRQQAYSTETLA
jgi:uncharacterized FlaG/YvyC family protein